MQHHGVNSSLINDLGGWRTDLLIDSRGYNSPYSPTLTHQHIAMRGQRVYS